MCTAPDIDVPEPVTPAAAPAAPLKTAENLRMQERPRSRDGRVSGNTARSRRTLRTDVNMGGVQAGANIARMGR